MNGEELNRRIMKAEDSYEILKDRVKDLMEENERLQIAINDTYETSQELLAEQETEINRLKKELNKHIKEGIEKDIIIDKAIKYIEEKADYPISYYHCLKELRAILQGSDKE